jgi:hypothetical protein
MRLFPVGLILGIGILFSPGLRADPPGPNVSARARGAVRVQLYDPNSARFRNVNVSAQGDVCG